MRHNIWYLFGESLRGDLKSGAGGSASGLHPVFGLGYVLRFVTNPRNFSWWIILRTVLISALAVRPSLPPSGYCHDGGKRHGVRYIHSALSVEHHSVDRHNDFSFRTRVPAGEGWQAAWCCFRWCGCSR